jgi:hypothetical protein
MKIIFRAFSENLFQPRLMDISSFWLVVTALTSGAHSAPRFDPGVSWNRLRKSWETACLVSAWNEQLASIKSQLGVEECGFNLISGLRSFLANRLWVCWLSAPQSHGHVAGSTGCAQNYYKNVTTLNQIQLFFCQIRSTQNKQTPWALVRERTIPTERRPLVDEM